MKIISFDKERIYTTNDNGITYLNKITKHTEIENLKKAKEYLSKKSVKIADNEYKIEIPKIYDWNEETNIVKMDFFNGINLETLLRTISSRTEAITFLNKLLEFILSNCFYWVDFSPRNILINKKNKKICFVDFEKGLTFEENNLIHYFRNHVYEEYSSFLLINERILNGEEIFRLQQSEKNMTIKKNEIRIKRVKATANKLNYPSLITQEQFLDIYRMFLIAELPQIVSQKIIFPRVELENILETKKTNPFAYDEYADKIIKLVKQNKKEKKIQY